MIERYNFTSFSLKPNIPSGIRSQNYNNYQLTQVFDKSIIGDKTMTSHHNTWYSYMTQMTWAIVCYIDRIGMDACLSSISREVFGIHVGEE